MIPVMVVKDDAWFCGTLFSSDDNLLAKVCGHLTVWDFVAEEDLVPRLDHLLHILSSDLRLHWSSCPGCGGDVDNLVDAIRLPDKDDDVSVLVEASHRVARVGLVVVEDPDLLTSLQLPTQHVLLDL